MKSSLLRLYNFLCTLIMNLTNISNVSRRADASKRVDAVNAFTCVEARIGMAIISIYFAVFASETKQALASVTVDSIVASPPIQTGR